MSDETNSNFFLIDNEFVLGGLMANLSGSAVKVYLCLKVHANQKTGLCFPSYTLIQKETGLGRAAVAAALKSMKENGLISVGKTENKNTYKLLHHTEWFENQTSLKNELVRKSNQGSLKSELALVRKSNSNNTNITKLNNKTNIPPNPPRGKCDENSKRENFEEIKNSNLRSKENSQTLNFPAALQRESKPGDKNPDRTKADACPSGNAETEKGELTRIFEEEFWPTYPSRRGRKLGKMEAKAWYLGNITLNEAPLTLTAVKHYAESGQIPRDCIRFLAGKKRDRDWDWRDWIEQEEGGTSGKIGSNGRYGNGSIRNGRDKWGPQAEIDLPECL